MLILTLFSSFSITAITVCFFFFSLKKKAHLIFNHDSLHSRVNHTFFNNLIHILTDFFMNRYCKSKPGIILCNDCLPLLWKYHYQSSIFYYFNYIVSCNIFITLFNIMLWKVISVFKEVIARLYHFHSSSAYFTTLPGKFLFNHLQHTKAEPHLKWISRCFPWSGAH